MAPLAEPQASLGVLLRTDGSATYSYGGYTITASANGPIDAQRRDEDPDEAAIDVIVRPAAGVGGPSERHLESVIQRTLQNIVVVQEFPRFLIQVVLQLQAAPENDYVNARLNQPSLNLGALPALLQAAVLALLSASIPMRTTATAASVACLPGDKLMCSYTPEEAVAALSTHVFAFAGDEDDEGDAHLLLNESEGTFSMDEWHRALAAARDMCCGKRGAAGDQHDSAAMALDDQPTTANDDGRSPDMHGFLRSTVQGKLEDLLQWKTA